jgi:glycosyltransferase involved in cell wall biosynthesis
LVRRGFDVHLVAHAEADALRDGVTLHALAPTSGRFSRMVVAPWRALRVARATGARLFHFHDAELIPVGLALKALGHRVVYDVHEDMPAFVLDKHWLPKWSRGPVSVLVGFLERFVAGVVDACVLARPPLQARLRPRRTVMVENHPILDQLPGARPFAERSGWQVVYAGVLAEEKGILELIAATAVAAKKYDDIRLLLAGSAPTASFLARMAATPGWDRVDFRGWIEPAAVGQLLASSRIGVVPLHPVANHLEAEPTKLFEYMHAGLAVISTDYPVNRQIVDRSGAGLVFPARDVGALADRIIWLREHPEEAAVFGAQGAAWVASNADWESQIDALVALYDELLAA